MQFELLASHISDRVGKEPMDPCRPSQAIVRFFVAVPMVVLLVLMVFVTALHACARAYARLLNGVVFFVKGGRNIGGMWGRGGTRARSANIST